MVYINVHIIFCVIVLWQVNSIVDVSRPFYGQLQTLTGTENSNVHVSATQSTQANKVSKHYIATCFCYFAAQLTSSE